MNPLLKIIPKVNKYLDCRTDEMIDDLVFMINRESKNPELAMFWFICSDNFKILIMSFDKSSEVITDVVGLPITNYEDLHSLDNYGSFLPFEFEVEEDDIFQEFMQGDSENKASFWKYSETYHNDLHENCVAWFRTCWSEATKRTNQQIPTCFSLHEGTDGIDLDTGKFLSENDIRKFFNSDSHPLLN